MKANKGFTIVEMLMVVAVLVVLTGIVTTATTSVIHKARQRANEALRVALQNGIATYRQQEGFWPPGKKGALQKWEDNGLDSKYRKDGKHVAKLENSDYDALMNHLALRCLDASKNRVMDFSDFVGVAQSATMNTDTNNLPVCRGKKASSMTASIKSKSARLNELTFGYAKTEAVPNSQYVGRFRRFSIYYNSDSDSVTVGWAKTKSGDDDK